MSKRFLSTPSARRATTPSKRTQRAIAISIHALREEGDGRAGGEDRCGDDFYPRPPRGGRPAASASQRAAAYFYPRPPRGGRPDGSCGWMRRTQNFYPRPPRGGRLCFVDFCSRSVRFLSTPSARRATNLRTTEGVEGKISIHALREEGDRIHLRKSASWSLYFYPRPPRGGRPSTSSLIVSSRLFLSTPSARRATWPMMWSASAGKIFLSTPSARRATAKTETKSLFSYKLYNILHEFRRALIYNGSKNYPNHAKRLENPVRRCRKDAENSPFAPGRKTQNNSRPSCSKGG